VAVLPDQIGAKTQVAVVYAERELIPSAVRAFVDAVVQWAREEPTFQQGLPVARPPARSPARRGSKRGHRR
ncbi:MAG: LysR family transcriptional regulator, partial [Nannocystaceae bacterium]